MEKITSRQRVLAALSHQATDRVPRDLGGTAVSGINLVAYRNLLAYLGLDLDAEIYRERIRHARVHEEVLQKYQIDTRPIFPPGCFEVGEQVAENICQDGFGIQRKLSSEDGHWNIISAPLMEGELSPSRIDQNARTWPDPDSEQYVTGLSEEARTWHQETQYAVVLTLPIGCFHQAAWLRGFDTLLLDFSLDPKNSMYLLEALTERWIALCKNILDACGDNIDVVVFLDDVAMGNGPMMSESMFDQILRPYERRVFSFLNETTEAKILFHSDGDICWHLEELIEMGVDAVNPVEVAAGRMGDTASLKEEFGDRMAFWGAIDTRHVMPFGSPGDVEDEVKRRVGDLDHQGGYVVSSVHNLLADVPPENIQAMFAALDRIAENPAEEDKDNIEFSN